MTTVDNCVYGILIVAIIMGWLSYRKQIIRQYGALQATGDSAKIKHGRRAIGWGIYTTIAASVYTIIFGGTMLSTGISTHHVMNIPFYGALFSGAIFSGRVGYGITSGARGTVIIDIISFTVMFATVALRLVFQGFSF